MKTPTYEQQWQKITEAYLKDKIRPYDHNFCFCGTLCNGGAWARYLFERQVHNSYSIYEAADFIRMETALLRVLHNDIETPRLLYDMWMGQDGNYHPTIEHPKYEQAVYDGMVAALEVLRQIHEAKGDPTAKSITLTKRQLQTV